MNAMRAVNVHGPNDVRVDVVPAPVPGDRDVIVKVAACGVCGTDLAYIRHGGGGAHFPLPLPIGHEAAGTVTAVGAAVSGVRKGMRVVVNPMGEAGVIGNGAPEGAFADSVLVRQVTNDSLLEIPEGLSFDIAALTEPLAVALHAVNRAEIKPGAKAAVFGAGPIGLGIVLWLKRMGAGPIVAIDTNSGRLARARALGATDTIVAGEGDLLDALIAAQGAAAPSRLGQAADTDVYFDAAGAATIVSDVVRAAKRFVRLIVVAIHHGEVRLDLARMLRKEMWITTSVGYPTELGPVLAALPSMRRELEHFVSGQFGFDQFLQAIDAAREPSSGKVVVTFDQ